MYFISQSGFMIAKAASTVTVTKAENKEKLKRMQQT